MRKTLVLTFPHDLAAEELRRRLDRRCDWAVHKCRDNAIALAIGPWRGENRGFRARALGQNVEGNVGVSDAALRFSISVPLGLRPFAPVIERLAKHYVAKLLDPTEGETLSPSSP